ncbi:hypothetical protein ACFC00_40160 [Streptomyces adustus]|uniref:hypothetical protein n=1 Tax=Streptomyces adustus TaxID=1609272 RepID=UPI0035DE8C9E
MPDRNRKTSSKGPLMVSLTELGVLAFAAYRGTQLVVHDSILDAPRGGRPPGTAARTPRPSAKP